MVEARLSILISVQDFGMNPNRNASHYLHDEVVEEGGRDPSEPVAYVGKHVGCSRRLSSEEPHETIRKRFRSRLLHAHGTFPQKTFQQEDQGQAGHAHHQHHAWGGPYLPQHPIQVHSMCHANPI